MIQFDYERFLRYILKTFQLDEIAQREFVVISITFDGAELCNGISHIMAGIKVTNGIAIDHQNEIPLCMTLSVGFLPINTGIFALP
jgi:hypothetical protein